MVSPTQAESTDVAAVLARADADAHRARVMAAKLEVYEGAFLHDAPQLGADPTTACVQCLAGTYSAGSTFATDGSGVRCRPSLDSDTTTNCFSGIDNNATLTAAECTAAVAEACLPLDGVVGSWVERRVEAEGLLRETICHGINFIVLQSLSY